MDFNIFNHGRGLTTLQYEHIKIYLHSQASAYILRSLHYFHIQRAMINMHVDNIELIMINPLMAITMMGIA